MSDDSNTMLTATEALARLEATNEKLDVLRLELVKRLLAELERAVAAGDRNPDHVMRELLIELARAMVARMERE